MTQLSQHPIPGYFYILSQPKPQYLEEYHDWYNTEHGPLRVKLGFVLNGYRYKSLDTEPPFFLACYDLSRVDGLEEPQYTVLRENRSAREHDLFDNKLRFLDRRVYKHISIRGQIEGPAHVVMTVAFVVKNEVVDELHRWYEEEHTADLMNIPGWIRSRRFELIESDDMKEGYTELLAVHDFQKDNGLDGPEHELAKSRPWRKKILEMVESRDNRRFEFFHQFEAADYRKPRK